VRLVFESDCERGTKSNASAVTILIISRRAALF
jgi:hypothetical protein